MATAAPALTPAPMAVAVGPILVPWVTKEGTGPAGPVTALPPAATATGTETTASGTGTLHLPMVDQPCLCKQTFAFNKNQQFPHYHIPRRCFLDTPIINRYLLQKPPFTNRYHRQNPRVSHLDPLDQTPLRGPNLSRQQCPQPQRATT